MVLREFLMSQPDIADKIQLIGKEDKRITGNFEVMVLGTKEIIHSAKHGQGKTDTLQAKQAIADYVRELLGK